MKSALVIPLITLILFTSVFSQTCTDCEERAVIVYDLDVKIPEPDYKNIPVDEQITAYTEWTNLFYIAGGIRKYVWQDPTTDCLKKLCSAFFTQPDSINTTIRTGVGYPNIPPSSGSLAMGDYIIYGVISGSSGSYSLQLNLETAISRELVKTNSVSFSTGFDPFKVGSDAVSAFGPLYTTILNFEKNKRDEGEPNAIKAKVEIIPEKTTLKNQESCNVKINATDCDGQALKSRTITLEAENGSFDKATITTDNEGNASAKFTAGDIDGVANLYAYFNYRRPTGKTYISEDGIAKIQINKSYWGINCTYTFIENVDFGQNIGAAKVDRTIERATRGQITGLLDMKSDVNGNYSTQKAVSISITGTGYELMNERSVSSSSSSDGSSYSNTVKTSHCNSDKKKSDQRINITLGKTSRHFAFTTNFEDMTGGGMSNTLMVICSKDGCHSDNSSEPIDCSSTPYGDGMHSYDASVNDQDTTYQTTDNSVPGMTVTHKIHQVSTHDENSYTFNYADDGTIEQAQEGLYKQVTTSKEYITMKIITNAAIGIKDQSTPENLSHRSIVTTYYQAPVLHYSLSRNGKVTCTIYNAKGRKIHTLINGFERAGNHSVKLTDAGMSTGMYYYTFEAEGVVVTKKLMMLP